MARERVLKAARGLVRMALAAHVSSVIGCVAGTVVGLAIFLWLVEGGIWDDGSPRREEEHGEGSPDGI